MDREGDRRITQYLAAYLLFAVLFSIFMWVLSYFLLKTPAVSEEIRVAELKEAVSLIEEKYGYELRMSPKENRLWLFYGAGLLAGAVCFLCFYLKNIRKPGVSGESLQELSENLEEFRKGSYLEVLSYEGSSPEWMRIWEAMRELSFYFEDLQGRLAREEESTKALITDISHQLKTPLASLRMSLELAMASEHDEKRGYEEQELKALDKLELLLGELVKLSRLETHLIQLCPETAELKETVAGAVSQIFMKAKEKAITISVEMEGSFCVCHDTKWTAEAIANVLDNAVKYSPAHSTVTVRATRLAQNVLVEVEDQGMGISAEELVKIYQRFYRGSRAAATVHEGIGVGLYLARMILEQQGGTISAKNKPEGGTVFRITLPCKTLTKML
ncbi:MAG: HAMP domain-containing histidine kinase [Blautia sp.]|nr:HAMP domain-containing histidine kinase [Blautia sp.]